MNWIIYTFISNSGVCRQSDSALAVVNQAPAPDFEFIELCVPTGGDSIDFRNISDTTGLGGTLTWEWNYGHIQSGEANLDTFLTMRDGTHFYPRSGDRSITLTATVQETGCTEAETKNNYIGHIPDITIHWNTECFTTDSTRFTGEAVTDDGNSNYSWKVLSIDGAELLAKEGYVLNNIAYKFEAIDNYRIQLTATTDRGCIRNKEEIIFLRPYITTLSDTTPYFEGFETGEGGWFSFKAPESSQNSWKVGAVEAGKFPYDLPGAGNMVWFTDSVTRNTVEQSWVNSPCFDFTGMRRPMISLDRRISSDRDRDGAVLQYSYDEGVIWHNVGAVNDGSINWYNTFRIAGGPGGQGEGWTGGFIFDKNEPWMNSRHELDDLRGRSRVQFRLAYSSSDTSIVDKEGFAFDNVWIGERSRVVLLEHFTNAGVEAIAATNRRINQLVRNNPLDMIDVQYHAEVEGKSDRMNADNPSPASARSLFYGTRQVPYTLLDGGLEGEMAYDFSENNDLDTLDLFSRALEDPSFDIELDVSAAAGKLDISIGLEALESMPSAEYIVFIAILEKHINDAAYLVQGGDTAFQNVVRDMLPNAAGESFNRSWNAGDKVSLFHSWNISEKVLYPELLNVVVFVQDAESRMVYQAASNDPDLNGDPVIHVSLSDVLKSGDIRMLLYPNPATGKAYLAFGEPLKERVEIQLFTHTGSLVRNDLLIQGTNVFEMDLQGLSVGIYFVRAIQYGRVIATEKLMIMR
jgi:hypothetical protein